MRTPLAARGPAARWAAFILCTTSACSVDDGPRPLRVQGSTTVRPVVAEAVERFGAELGARVTVDTLGGSSGGISSVCQGLSDVGMSSKPVTDADRDRFPGCDLRSHPLGYDAVGLVVSAPVHDGGLTSLRREEVAAVFAGRVTRWSELGGPDLPVFVYDKEPGRGTREVFERWAYAGASPPAPDFSHRAEVGGNEESRHKVADHGSAITQLSAAWVEPDGPLRLVGIELEDGTVTWPSPEAIRDRTYPMWRPLLLLTDGPPDGVARELLDRLTSPEGQQLLPRHGYLPLATP